MTELAWIAKKNACSLYTIYMGQGVEIITADPKPEIRKHAENAPDWEFREEAKHLYEMATNFKDRFLDPILRTDRGRLPEPVISFDRMNRKTLAAYTLVRNPQGLLDEITFNTAHYEQVDDVLVWKFGRWAQYETLLHEQVHLWQQNFGDKPVKPGRAYHNREFVDKCESLGLHPKLGPGYHIAPADGVFAAYMGELGIEPPEPVLDVRTAEDTKGHWFKENKKGTSTLHKWVCPECDLIVRYGRMDDPQLVHEPCGVLLVRES